MRPSYLHLLLLACIGPAFAGGAPPTGWRGRAAGRYPEAKPPTEWSDDAGIVWQVDAGEGRSSPVLVGDRIFVTAEPDELVCLSAADGKVLWRRRNGAEELPPELRNRDLESPTECGYATPTPVCDGRHVYALFGNGVVACYDLEGTRKWIHLIEIRQTEEHGRAASPVLVGNRLVIHVTDLFCLDAATGKTVWQKPSATAFGTPLPLRVGGVDVVVTPKGDVFRVSDGEKLGSGLGALEVASPVVHEGVLYFIGSVARAVRLPGALEGGRFPKPAQLWRVLLRGQFYASPIVHEGLIYAVNKKGLLVVLEAASGATVFSKKLSVGSECAPSFCLVGGKLYLYTDAGVTVILEPGRSYKEVRRCVLSQGAVATPTFAGDRMFIRSDLDLMCIRAGAKAAARPAAPQPAARGEGPAPAQPGPAAAGHAGPVLSGWRGNGTGLFPDATPVLQWGRTCKGITPGMKTSVSRPKGAAAADAIPLRHHFPRRWLVLGPFPAPKGLEEPALADEAAIEPTEGEAAAGHTWTTCAVPEDVFPPAERDSVAGAGSMRFVEPGKVLGEFKPGHLVYAHTYVYAPQEGEADFVVDHTAGLRVWLNGEQLYSKASTEVRLNYYTILGRFRDGSYPVVPSPRIRLKLRKGWNRLLLKLAHGRRNWKGYSFGPRIVDLPTVAYEDRNILWAAPLPDRSSSTPILVGDRIFLMAEPDQLVCLDKATGKQLWTRFLGRYQATPKAERDANPAFRQTVEPLVAKLATAQGLKDRMALRREIDKALVAIDAKKYTLNWDGHMKSHFRIVGWTLPTPCSDGSYVYVYCGNGVAACYDLEGNTRWIDRVNPGQMHYPAAPALVDGTFVIFASGGFNMVALDARTGQVRWRQPKVTRSVGALVGARINGVGVVISQAGDIVRVADGKILYSDPVKRTGDTGWAPAACIGNVVYLPVHGVSNLMVKDFSAAQGEAWTCEQRDVGGIAISRNSKGTWIDRWTCGSPLIHEGIYYNVDVFGTLYAADLQTRKVLYRQDVSHEFDSLSHYNAVGVAASVTLGGKHLFAMGNQGVAVVFEPGPTFKQVAVNRIAQQVYRPWPIRPQEEIGYSPPLFEGSRMYLRGEYFFYCIGTPEERPQ